MKNLLLFLLFFNVIIALESNCGDGTCNGDENCSNCPKDCGECPPCIDDYEDDEDEDIETEIIPEIPLTKGISLNLTLENVKNIESKNLKFYLKEIVEEYGKDKKMPINTTVDIYIRNFTRNSEISYVFLFI